MPVAASHVEHRLVPVHLVGREGQDLLLVLGVGPTGEVLDPPVGVLLPEVAGGVAVVVGHDAGG